MFSFSEETLKLTYSYGDAAGVQAELKRALELSVAVGLQDVPRSVCFTQKILNRKCAVLDKRVLHLQCHHVNSTSGPRHTKNISNLKEYTTLCKIPY